MRLRAGAIQYTAAAAVAGTLVAAVLWPRHCLWMPSDPPQFGGCTSMLGTPTSEWTALVGGIVAALAVLGLWRRR